MFSKLEPDLKEENEPLTANSPVESIHVLGQLFTPAAMLWTPGFSAEVMTWAVVQAAEKPGALGLLQRLSTPGTHMPEVH